VSTVMRAVGIMAFGGPEVLRLVELPDPQAGPGELRLRVHAARSIRPIPCCAAGVGLND
jgi:NADPH:quinone reductase-like Zn-dependent oxidoreductase